jgi:hypothetical protein
MELQAVGRETIRIILDKYDFDLFGSLLLKPQAEILFIENAPTRVG